MNQVEINEGGTKDYKNKLRGCPTVKDNTKQKYNEVLVFLISQIIEYQEERKKVYQEDYAAENHDLLFGKPGN